MIGLMATNQGPLDKWLADLQAIRSCSKSLLSVATLRLALLSYQRRLWQTWYQRIHPHACLFKHVNQAHNGFTSFYIALCKEAKATRAQSRGGAPTHAIACSGMHGACQECVT